MYTIKTYAYVAVLKADCVAYVPSEVTSLVTPPPIELFVGSSSVLSPATRFISSSTNGI